MFDIIASGAQAYNQIGFFVGALVCIGLGGLVLGNALYWRVHARRVSGIIVGVLNKNGSYAPVYRYVLPDGQSLEAQSDTSSGSVAGKETGRVVPLMISAHNPSSAREANSYLLEIIGAILIAPGILFAYIAVTAYPVTWMTWIMAAVMLVYLAEHGRRLLIPKGQRLSVGEWKKQHGATAVSDPSQIRPIEALVSPDVAQERVRTERSQARKWAPLVGIFALLLAALGVHQSISLAHLETSGLRAAGQVIRLKEESSSGTSRSYHPVVQFRTQDNIVVEFKDPIGSNPPTYRPGDKVTVLYLASNPHHEAIIDRGAMWNWTIPGILFLVAIGIAAIFILLLRRGTQQSPAVVSAN